MKIINPATEEVIQDVLEDSKQSVEMKFELLRQAQTSWGQVELGERIKVLQSFSDLLQKNIEHLAFVLTSEVGKPLQQSRNEVNGEIGRAHV